MAKRGKNVFKNNNDKNREVVIVNDDSNIRRMKTIQFTRKTSVKL
jgi:hypothetical protein